jgi:threonylcarbamoyladenosine tRNA methylthiotransferase MtaB
MFQDTLKLVDEAGLTYLHVFPYSPRDGTPAVNMPQVPIDLRKERSKRLREKGNLAKTIYLDQLLGSKAIVLIEEKGRGYTEHYAPVKISQKLESGFIHQLRITGHNNQILSAELLP